MSRYPVDTERTKSRTVVEELMEAGEEPSAALQRLRSWALTRGMELTGTSSWTLPGEGAPFHIRHDITDRAEVEILPEEPARVRTLPSVFVLRASGHGRPGSPAAIAEKLAEWAAKYGYEVVDGEAEVILHSGEGDFEVLLPVRRPEREDFITVEA
ncbi:MAG: hypothetical protein U5Q44_00630 [Dehalococcoidia bacterium]|nr:hypothetical protein [Dehalococcoidia bacterium]